MIEVSNWSVYMSGAGCEECGMSNPGECLIHGSVITVTDNKLPSRARLSLPSVLALKTVKDNPGKRNIASVLGHPFTTRAEVHILNSFVYLLFISHVSKSVPNLTFWFFFFFFRMISLRKKKCFLWMLSVEMSCVLGWCPYSVNGTS